MSENTPESETPQVDPQNNAGQQWWQQWLEQRFSDGALVTFMSPGQSPVTGEQRLMLPPKVFEFVPDDPADSEFSESEPPSGSLRIVAIDYETEFPMGFTVDTANAGSVSEEKTDGYSRVVFRATDKRVLMSSRISDVHRQMIKQVQESGF